MKVITNIVALRDDILAAIVRHRKIGNYQCKCRQSLSTSHDVHLNMVIDHVINENTAEMNEIL
jgi:hypothetical protein